MQKVQADADKRRTYRAVVHLKDRRLVPLASEDMPDVTVNDTDAVALGSSDLPYRQMISWDSSHNDYYAVNLQDGSRRKLIEKSRFAATLSPGGSYLLVFDADDSHWYSVRVSDGVRTNLTAKLGVRFEDESNDTPEPARAYGSAGWTSGDRSVLLYDKYDIWEVRPDGTDARLVTGGAGRKAQIVFRYVRTDPEERIFPSDKPFFLSAVNDVTKATGYYRVTPTAAAPAPAARPARGRNTAPSPAPLAASYGEPARLVMVDKRLASPTAGGGPGGAGPGGGGGGPVLLKPRNADGPFILTASRFEEFPDLWTAGPNLENLTKVSDANPQQSQFVWGRSELIEYINADGRTLRAILTKPENFDPAKKYPLMVYIYEELTNGLHSYATPSPGTSINLARYVSNGYILLQPDIVYTTGYPGERRVQVRAAGRAARPRDGLRRPGARGHPGPQLGRLSDHLPHHAHRYVPRGPGGRVGVEHGERVRRHPLGHRHVAGLPVRAHAEPHRRAALDQVAAVHRELADLLGRESEHAVPDDSQ